MKIVQDHIFLREIHIIGSKTRERFVSPAECPALAEQKIHLCGLSDAAPPYRMIRPSLPWTETLVTLTGNGMVWQGGRWRLLRPGEAYVAPRGCTQAFFAPRGGRWRFAWVQTSRFLSTQAAWVTPAEGVDLESVISLLHHEVLGRREGTILTHLAALVNALSERIAGPAHGDERLRKLWRAVDEQLGKEWTVASLSAFAGLSGEQLRRLCQAETGLAPMEHVTGLRMRRASALLRSSPSKIEVVAGEVGYGSVYSFAAAFKRWSGQAPGAWRRGAALDVLQ